MFLYELALELDETSGSIAQRAAALGLGNLTPASFLEPGQISALRSSFGKTTLDAPGAPPSVAQGSPAQPPARTKLLIAAAVVLAIGALGFIALNLGASDENEQVASSDDRASLNASSDLTADPTNPQATEPSSTAPDAGDQTISDEAALASRCIAAQNFFTYLTQLEGGTTFEERQATAAAVREDFFDALDALARARGSDDDVAPALSGWYTPIFDSLAATSTQADYMALAESKSGDLGAAEAAMAKLKAEANSSDCHTLRGGTRIDG